MSTPAPTKKTYVCPTCGKPLFEWDPEGRVLTIHGCRVWFPAPGSPEPGRVYCSPCGAYVPSVPASIFELLRHPPPGP